MPIDYFAIAESHAHQIASALAAAAVPAPESSVTRSARIEGSGIKVVVTIVKDESMHISPETLAQIEAMRLAQEPPKCPGSVGSSDVSQCILEAAPTGRETTLKALARRSGYAYTQWFREKVAALVDAGKLVRTARGIRRA